MADEINKDKASVKEGRNMLPAYRYNFYGLGPKNYHRPDQRILEDVCDALYHSYDVDASHIEVEVHDGIVRLAGKVENREEKRAAEDCVDNVMGVRDIRNELKFERTPIIQRSISTPEDEKGTRLS